MLKRNFLLNTKLINDYLTSLFGQQGLPMDFKTLQANGRTAAITDVRQLFQVLYEGFRSRGLEQALPENLLSVLKEGVE